MMNTMNGKPILLPLLWNGTECEGNSAILIGGISIIKNKKTAFL